MRAGAGATVDRPAAAAPIGPAAQPEPAATVTQPRDAPLSGGPCQPSSQPSFACRSLLPSAFACSLSALSRSRFAFASASIDCRFVFRSSAIALLLSSAVPCSARPKCTSPCVPLIEIGSSNPAPFFFRKRIYRLQQPALPPSHHLRGRRIRAHVPLELEKIAIHRIHTVHQHQRARNLVVHVIYVH